MAYIFDIQIDQGTDTAVPMEFFDHDRRPMNFEGCSARMQIRRTASSDIVIDELSSEGEAPRLTFDVNVICADFPRQITQAIKAGRYCYDLELTTDGGNVYRLIEGAFILRKEVTR